jgi:hypothetical protein
MKQLTGTNPRSISPAVSKIKAVQKPLLLSKRAQALTEQKKQETTQSNES